jgi:tRNA(Ile)-lysidine synthase
LFSTPLELTKMIEQTFIKELQHLAGDDFAKKRYLIAVSGGVDSMVLCHLFMQHQLYFSVAHCNFMLRGEESYQDEAFVRDFAKKNTIELFVKQFDTGKIIEQEGGSVQQVARKLRYDWFYELLPNFDFLVTAHHSDDNIETFFINLSRGTGLKGLMGIPSENEKIIRPLLKTTKAKILEYAQQQSISWREDSSNESDKYTRNFYRNQIIPLIKKQKPGFDNVMTGNIEMLKKTKSLLDHFIGDIRKEVVHQVGGRTKIMLRKIKKYPAKDVILYELINQFGFNYDQAQGILGVIESGKTFLSKEYKAIYERGELLITRRDKRYDFDPIVFNSIEELEQSELFEVEVIDVPPSFFTEKNTAYFDVEKITFPLTIRNWQQGDVFYPFGMKGKKKLSDFFVDQKFSQEDKQSVFVLLSGEKIAWVVGYRSDNRFRVSKNTKKVLKLVTR